MIGLVNLRGETPTRLTARSDVGRLAEDIAASYLRRRGCTVVARHFRARSGEGEIDLVACQGAALVFVKVRRSTTEEYGAPDCAVHGDKRQILEQAAGEYLARCGVERIKMRFDVISVTLDNPVRVDWRRDVFRPVPGQADSAAVARKPSRRALGESKSKVSFSSAAIGGAMAALGCILVMTPLLLLEMIRLHLRAGAPGAIAAALGRHQELWAALAMALGICCALGGYVAAWIRNRHELIHGMLSSFLCVGIGAWAAAAGARVVPLPAVLALLTVSPLAGWLGGYLRWTQRHSWK